MSYASYLDQEKYRNEFNSKAYLNSMFCDAEVFMSEMQILVDFYSHFEKDSLQVLDYAAGPSIMAIIPAVPKASKIIMADYLVDNRKELKKWLKEDSESFDWTPTIKQIMSLEGKNAMDGVQNRVAFLREKIKAVVHCDLAADPIIDQGYEGPYDVVNCNGLLDAICPTKDVFVQSVQKLASLVKKGGYLIADTDESDSYSVAGATFSTPLSVTKDDIQKAFSKAGFSIFQFTTFVSFDKATLTIAQKR